MTTYLIRRLLLMIPTLLGITLAVFMLVALSPGGVAAGIMAAGDGDTGSRSAAAQREYIEKRYGLDAPVLVQYGRWLGKVSPLKFGSVGTSRQGPAPSGVMIVPGAVRLDWPDLGQSFVKGRSVAALIAETLPNTLLINVIGFAIVYLIAIPGGVLAAVRRNTWLDRALTTLFIGLWSLPVVCAGVLALGYLSSNKHLGWFPGSGLHDADAAAFLWLPSVDDTGGFHRGYVLDTLWHLALPVACQAYVGFALLARQTRAAMIESLGADHVRTARAKGLPEHEVVIHHALRNSLLPIITMFASVFPAMLSGSVVVERIFSINGMGSLVVEAIYLRDRDLLLGVVLIAGVVNVLAMLLADILYAAADPRVSYA